MIIEKVICDYLKTKLDCPVLPERPPEVKGRMVFVEKTGGNGRFLVQSTVVIQSYETSMYKAAKLNDDVIEAMYGLVELNDICRVDLNSNYNYTDATTKEHRYQAVFDINHY